MADGPESRFNRVAGPNALPVLRREVIKSHHLVAAFLQTGGSLWTFWLIHFNEQVEGFFSICLCLGPPLDQDDGLFSPGFPSFRGWVACFTTYVGRRFTSL